MASARVLRLAGAAALVAAALPVTAPAAGASFPGSNGSLFLLAQEGDGDNAERNIERWDPNGTFGGNGGSDVTEFTNHATSADGSKLAYSKNGDIVVVDLETFQEQTVVATGGGDRDPAFSLDGRYLVYSSDVADNNAEIYVKDLTAPSAAPIRLTNNTVDDFAPAWGDDGTGHGDLIAFVRIESETDSEIYTMTPDGSAQTNLTNNDVFDFGPNWHPSFDKLAYSSRDANDVDQINTMSWDGTDKDQLTATTDYNYEPAWSPDGTLIAFTRQAGAQGSRGRIFVRTGNPGGTETPVTPVSSTTSYDRAEWQAFPGGCEPNCGGEPVKPTLVFSLRKHVVVSGSAIGLTGEGPAGGICGVGTPIKIQRKIDGKFKTIASAVTNSEGNFSKKVPDKTGSYRVTSTAYTDEANGTECLASSAAAKVHRHR